MCEIYPQSLLHNSNGRFAVVTGDGEYIIYTALAWRKKSFGNALDFVWALDSGEYAVRESPMSIKLFKNFKETRTFKPPFAADALLGGALMCAPKSHPWTHPCTLHKPTNTCTAPPAPALSHRRLHCATGACTVPPAPAHCHRRLHMSHRSPLAPIRHPTPRLTGVRRLPPFC